MHVKLFGEIPVGFVPIDAVGYGFLYWGTWQKQFGTGFLW